MREPYDTLIPANKQLDEALGKVLAKEAAGGAVAAPEQAKTEEQPEQMPDNSEFLRQVALERKRVGDSAYYVVLGRDFGEEKPEDIEDRKKQVEFYKALQLLPTKE